MLDISDTDCRVTQDCAGSKGTEPNDFVSIPVPKADYIYVIRFLSLDRGKKRSLLNRADRQQFHQEQTRRTNTATHRETQLSGPVKDQKPIDSTKQLRKETKRLWNKHKSESAPERNQRHEHRGTMNKLVDLSPKIIREAAADIVHTTNKENQLLKHEVNRLAIANQSLLADKANLQNAVHRKQEVVARERIIEREIVTQVPTSEPSVEFQEIEAPQIDESQLKLPAPETTLVKGTDCKYTPAEGSLMREWLLKVKKDVNDICPQPWPCYLLLLHNRLYKKGEPRYSRSTIREKAKAYAKLSERKIHDKLTQ